MEAKLNQDNLEDLDSFVLWQGFDKYWEEFEITKDESLLEFCLAYCKTLSNRSDTDAMVALGDIYHGASVDRVIYGGGHLESFYIPKCRYRDYKSAAYWYEEAALGGNINGLERFAKTLYYGWGVPTNAENDQAAFELFKSVSENTDNRELLAEAFFFMADMICSDECTCKDYTLAASYAKIGMDLGDSSSTCLLGSLYLEGIGLDKDYSEAIRLFNLVYNRDKNPYAPYNLGEIFKEGLGVEIDIEQAMHWYSVASELGHPKAEKELKKICSC